MMYSMKQFLKRVVLFLLTRCAILAIALHKPTVIAITGSVGKTTTKDMIVAILAEAGRSVRGSYKSYNSEFGVPLSIFNLSSFGGRMVFGWAYNVFAAFLGVLVGIPRHIVLEVGLEQPGDITSLVRWLRPSVSVLTRLPTDPVHRENFPDRESLYREKVSLLEATRRGGYAVFNAEDTVQKPYIDALPDSLSLRPFNGGDSTVVTAGAHCVGGRPVGTDAVLSVGGTDEPFYIPDTLGAGAVQSLIAAVTAVRCVDPPVPVSVIRRAIASREPTPGRMRILPGYKNSIIIDDTYNASPIALREALRTLEGLSGKPKVAVLGVMAQIGDRSREIHHDMGEYARRVADYIFVVGDADYGEGDTVRYCGSHAEAADACRRIAADGAVFLCKGSQVARIEKVAERLLDSRVNPDTVLVRRGKEWK